VILLSASVSALRPRPADRLTSSVSENASCRSCGLHLCLANQTSVALEPSDFRHVDLRLVDLGCLLSLANSMSRFMHEPDRRLEAELADRLVAEDVLWISSLLKDPLRPDLGSSVAKQGRGLELLRLVSLVLLLPSLCLKLVD